MSTSVPICSSTERSMILVEAPGLEALAKGPRRVRRHSIARLPWRLRATPEELARQDERRKTSIRADYMQDYTDAWDAFESHEIDNDEFRARVRAAMARRDDRLR